MVIIVNPHLKCAQDYPVYKEAQELGVLVKDKHEEEFQGFSWSDISAWIDFFNPNSWEWYKALYKFNGRADGKWSWSESTDSVHIWNDMNEVQAPFSPGPSLTSSPPSNSHRSRAGQNVRWIGMPSITGVGNTETFTISTACFLRRLHFRPLKRGRPLTVVPLFLPVRFMLGPRGLQQRGPVAAWPRGSTWLSVCLWFSQTISLG